MTGSFSKIAFPNIGGFKPAEGDPITNKIQEAVWKKAGGDENPNKGILMGGVSQSMLSNKLKEKFGE